MKAAVIIDQKQAPIFADFKEPMQAPDHQIVRVQASSISQITRARASASHYSSQHEVPFVPGFDGVGTLPDGTSVYFLVPRHPFGAMAEYSLVEQKHCIAIPQTLPVEVAAAMAIPGMSSWAALVEQANMKSGQTVLVNGANGTSGRLAIQIAKYLGAKKIIATARRTDVFEAMYALGAHQCILLTELPSEMEAAFKPVFSAGIDVVLDYLWGQSALSLIDVAAKNSPADTPIHFVQIGSIAGATIPLPAYALRSSGLRLIGSGLGSLSIAQMLRSVYEVLHHAPTAGFHIPVQATPLTEVTNVWGATSSDTRTVLMI